jgi:hypothetical protein
MYRASFIIFIITKNAQIISVHYISGRAVAQWLRHYATNRLDAGSIPDGVIGIFQ